jgi:HAMP domain-containing protein
MIRSLVESAFQTGCLSVASEGLIGQVLATKGYQSADLEALVTLYNALNSGQIHREARSDAIQRLAESCQQRQVSVSSSYCVLI